VAEYESESVPVAMQHVQPAAGADQTMEQIGWAVDWGHLLRTARQVAGLSLTALSERTALSKGYLSKLESGAAGAANPSRSTLAALARALPSFRPLAHTLAPGLGADGLDFSGLVTASSSVDVAPRDPAPIHLGWRDLEVLAALVTLDGACLPEPITAPVVARAVQREVRRVRAILAGLVETGVVRIHPPARPGALPSYSLADGAAERIGVTRLGDLLVLAGALLAGAPGRT
jgi:transcriptional regulator with XRE-family HTH domain